MVSYMRKQKSYSSVFSASRWAIEGEEQDFKPEMILHYNKTKSALDTLWVRLRTSRRWPLALFFDFIDIPGHNVRNSKKLLPRSIPTGNHQRSAPVTERFGLNSLRSPYWGGPHQFDQGVPVGYYPMLPIFWTLPIIWLSTEDSWRPLHVDII